MGTPRLLLGPLLRYVDRHDATFWVETDRACTVTVTVGEKQTREPTWAVHGHHYALLQVTGLPEGAVLPYEVHLDDTLAWPEPGSAWPASVVRTLVGGGDLRLAFGSCRRVAPFEGEGLRDFGADALAAMAYRMRDEPHDVWPDALFMLGDQIYADEPSPQLRQRLAREHAPVPPGREEVEEEVWNFEEYTWLYDESWSPDPVRWLLSTVPTCMLLDDHDLRDDWNTSAAWRAQVEAQPWWRDRVVGAFSSYWVYQHLGNLSPEHLADDALFATVKGTDEDTSTAALDEFAWRADAEVGAARWSFVRDFGEEDDLVRLVAIDCRASRRLGPGRRAMVDDHEWEWVVEQARRPAGHLLLASTLPLLLPRGIHHVEGWDEEVASGSHGPVVARIAEQVRQVIDLEHWAAFRDSFGRFVQLLREVCGQPQPPAGVFVLSGDVHCSYTAPAHLQGVSHTGTVIAQLTMSPFRNPLPRALRLANRMVERRGVLALLRRLSASVGVPDTGLDWEIDHGPDFANGVMTLVFSGGRARLLVDHAHVEHGRQVLNRRAERVLTTHPPAPVATGPA